MKLFFDTEFTGLHQNTTLISLGIISEKGDTFYAEFDDFAKEQVNKWLIDNVFENNIYLDHSGRFKASMTQLIIKFGGRDELLEAEGKLLGIKLNDGNFHYSCFGNRVLVKERLLIWLDQFDHIEFWSDVLAYDWVLLQGLLADYTNGYPQLPPNVDYIPYDLATLLKVCGVDPDINREEFAEIKGGESKHNALWDAQVIKKCYEKMESTFDLP